MGQGGANLGPRGGGPFRGQFKAKMSPKLQGGPFGGAFKGRFQAKIVAARVGPPLAPPLAPIPLHGSRTVTVIFGVVWVTGKARNMLPRVLVSANLEESRSVVVLCFKKTRTHNFPGAALKTRVWNAVETVFLVGFVLTQLHASDAL